MSEKENEDPKNAGNKAEEPEIAFKRVRFFDSFEEMNQFEHRQYASMTPEERLHAVLKIRNQVLPEQSSSQSRSHHLYFKNDGDNS